MYAYDLMSSKIFGSSGRRSNPIGVISILTGLAGALASAVLWIYRLNPETTILGRYGAELGHGSVLTGQLAMLAAILGLMAVIGSVVSSTGGEGASGYFIGLVLGLVALSYPVLSWLNVISGSVRPGFLE
jgi:hypothetical protein